MEVANDIWTVALVKVETVDKAVPEPVPASILKLLSEYEDVFSKPKTLPPKRQYDHAINLEPGTTPINTRPYRYSLAQKDEIEKQVQEMLWYVSNISIIYEAFMLFYYLFERLRALLYTFILLLGLTY